MQNDTLEEIEEGREPKNLREFYNWCFLNPDLLKEFELKRTPRQRLKDWRWFWRVELGVSQKVCKL